MQAIHAALRKLPHAAGQRKAAAYWPKGIRPIFCTGVSVHRYLAQSTHAQRCHVAWQNEPCTHLMAQIVPVVIDIMMAHPETVWGEACYPVVSS